MGCLDKHNCEDDLPIRPDYQDDGCLDQSVDANCIPYKGPDGTCIPFVMGESIESILLKVDKELCKKYQSVDRKVAASEGDTNPGYLIDKFQDTDYITWEVVIIDGEYKLQAILNSSAICEDCQGVSPITTTSTTTTVAPTTTTTTSSTTTLPTTTTSTTTTLPINVIVQNFVPNASINSVVGATGYTLSGSVNNGQTTTGRHNSFNNTISVNVVGIPGISKLILRRNFVQLECLDVTFAGTYTFSQFTFNSGDLLSIDFQTGVCVPATTTTTSTTTTALPTTTTTSTSTTTTSTTTTIPVNLSILNFVPNSSIPSVGTIGGYSLPNDLTNGQSAYGYHAAFSNSIHVDVAGSPSTSKLVLKKNGSILECIDVSAAGHFVFSSFSFTTSDYASIEFLSGTCLPITTSTTSTTTSTTTTLVPPTTTTTSTSTSTSTTLTTSSTTTQICPEVNDFSATGYVESGTIGLARYGILSDGNAPTESEMLAGSSIARNIANDVVLNWGASSSTPVFYWFALPTITPNSLKTNWYESPSNNGLMLSESDLFDVPSVINISGQPHHVYITEYATQFTSNDYTFSIST